MTYMNLRFRKGFEFHRTSLASVFTTFPFRPQTIFTTKRSPVSTLTYWYREHTSRTKLPVLFIHGIGIGLYPYTAFLGDLNSTKGLEGDGLDNQVGIIAIEIMPVSFRITRPALLKEAMCREIASILAYHGWDKVVLVAHSYGSVISTHLLKSPATAPLIGPVVLIDPVSILLHLPDVAYNFTRRKPKRANEHQLYYFASMDMFVSHTLARRFFWTENILWKKDIEGRNVTVGLSGRDLIVDTEAVGRYLISNPDTFTPPVILIDVENAQNKVRDNIIERTREIENEDVEEPADAWKERIWTGKGIDVLWFANCDHAQVFDKPSTRRPLLRAIRAYCAQG
jgi:pimeloyl-ACP methyl ester carboxylesterase